MTRKFIPRSPIKRSLSPEVVPSSAKIRSAAAGSSSSSTETDSGSKGRTAKPPSSRLLPVVARASPLHFASVHHRNFYLASRPVILVFEVAGIALYHLFNLLRTFLLLLWRPLSSSWNNYQQRKWRRGQERVNNETLKNSVRVRSSDKDSDNSYDRETLTVGESQLVDSMSGGYSSAGQNVPMNMKGGPGLSDPLIARQKHHHRRAFELISKALRIDESDAGKDLLLNSCFPVL